jgi:uncharacterized membrane protein YfcA
MVLDIALYLAVGAAAGLLAGLLGVGGGLIIVAALAWLLPLRGFPPEHVMHVALATSLASIILTSVSSTRAHWRRGSVLWPSVKALAPGMVLGGLGGAQLASHLPSDALRWFVAGYCLVAALQLCFGQVKPGADAAAQAPAGPRLFVFGVGIGLLSALVGIGGGSMTVPLLVWLGVAPVRAVGTSAACGFAIAVASAVGFVYGGHAASGLPAGSLGFVYLPAAAGIALASILVAPQGVRLAHALSGPALKQVFAGFLLLMGLFVALSG